MGVVGMANGVTLRQQAQAKAAHLERLLLASQKITHVGSWEWNRDTGEVVWSDELYRIFGLRPQEEKITIDRLLAPLPPEESARARGEARRSVEYGSPFTFDHQIVRPDGQRRTLEVRGEPVRDQAGRVWGLIGTCQDVTERREHEERIQTYLEVGQNVPIGLSIWELGPGDPPVPVLLEFNRRALEMGADKEHAGPYPGRAVSRHLRHGGAGAARRRRPGGEEPGHRAARAQRPRLRRARVPRPRTARGRRPRRHHGAGARRVRAPAGEGRAAAARGAACRPSSGAPIPGRRASRS